jgi:hypothetical protein
MTEEDARGVFKRHRWFFSIQERRGRGKRFIYAKKCVDGHVISRYIIAESKLADMTEEKILARLVI